MRLLKIAESYVLQAKARLEDAREALPEKNYPYAVRLSQECVELCLKAVLKAVGIEYPKVHEVSDVLVETRERFPDWFKMEINFLQESSKILESKREPSFYGGEGFIAPEEIISKGDAEDATKRAEKVFKMCKRLLTEIKRRRV